MRSSEKLAKKLEHHLPISPKFFTAKVFLLYGTRSEYNAYNIATVEDRCIDVSAYDNLS